MSKRGAPSGTCASCHRKVARLELDHRKPLWAGGRNDSGNLQWLCRPCHRRKTSREMRSGAYRIHRTRRKPVPHNNRLRTFVMIVVIIFVLMMIF